MRDLLDSRDLDKLFGSRAARYREQFYKIAQHEGVLERGMGDDIVLRRLATSRAFAWNWLGFLLTVFWGAYWRLPTAWMAVGIIVAVDISAHLFGFEIGSALGIAVGVLFGYMGNSYLLQEVVKRAQKQKLDKYSPSLPLAFLALLVVVSEVVISSMIFEPELFSQM